jgi:hypothetical protein
MVYARLEETSFRSGAAACAAVLAAAAVAITLAGTMGGHQAAAARAADADPVRSSAVPWPRASARSPAGPARPASHTAGGAAPEADRRSGPEVTPAAAAQPSHWPSPARLPLAAEPAWPQPRWPAAGPPPARLLPWSWGQPWPGQPWPPRNRHHGRDRRAR